MGNKATSLSPTESIQDLLDGNIALRKCSCEEVATHLGIVVVLASHVAFGDILLNKQQNKDLIRVSDIIIKMLDDIYSGNIDDPDIILCQEKALQALLRLLVIPQFAKRTFDHSVVSIMNHTNTSSVRVFTLAFIAFFNGFRFIDEEVSVISGLRQGISEHESSRNSVCILMDKIGVYPRLMHFLTQTSAREDDENMILTSILIFRLLSWILTRTSNATNSLRFKLRQILLQHQDTLFELTRHRSSSLSDMAIGMMILLLRLEEPSTCVAMQDAARGYGALLWIFHRLVSLILEAVNARKSQDVGQLLARAPSPTLPPDSSTSQPGPSEPNIDDIESHSVAVAGMQGLRGDDGVNDDVSTERQSLSESSNLINGLIDQRFLPPRKKATKFEQIQKAQLCVSLLCIGNQTNASVIMSAMPAAMREALYPQSSYMLMNLLRYISTPTDTIQSSAFAEKMGGDNAAWYMFFGLLPHNIENPLLIWNVEMLNHLLCVLKAQCDNLDYMRQLRHEAWDEKYLDVDYSPVYEKQKYVVVQGVFLHRIIDVLELGKSDYIRDPVAFAWALVDYVLTSNPSACDGIQSPDEEKSLLALRALHMLLLRYHKEITNKVPVRSLCEILRMGFRVYSSKGPERMSIANSPYRMVVRNASDSSLPSAPAITSKLSGTCSPRWLHRCVNILRLRRHNSSRADMVQFAACGCIDTLLRVLSTHDIVSDMCLFVTGDDDDDMEDKSSVCSSLNAGGDGPSTPRRPSAPPVAFEFGAPQQMLPPTQPNQAQTQVQQTQSPDTLLKRLSLARSRPPPPLGANELARKEAYAALQQKTVSTTKPTSLDDDINQYVVTSLVHGSAVLVDTAALLHTLVHESTVCAQHIASNAELVEKLMRCLWLLSPHGPYQPHSVPVALESMLQVVLRVLHSLPDVMYSSILLNTKFIHVVIATGITPNGTGVMTSAAIELLSDVISGVQTDSGVPFRRAPSPLLDVASSSTRRSESDSSMPTGEERASISEDSPTTRSRRLSLRQAVISEASELSVDPFGPSIENEDSARVLMSRSKRSVRSKLAPLPSVLNEVSYVIPLQLARLCVDLVPKSFCSNVFNAEVRAADGIWNSLLRSDLVVGLYRDLADWHFDAFGISIDRARDASALIYSSICAEPQLSGVFLGVLLRLQSPKEVIGPFDVRVFGKDIIAAMQRSVSEARRGQMAQLSARSGPLNEDAQPKRRSSSDGGRLSFEHSAAPMDLVITPQSGPNDALLAIAAEKRIALLLLCLGKVISNFAFPEDVWYADTIPVLCNLIDTFCTIMDKAISNSFRVTSEACVEVCANSVVVIVQSLTAAGFVEDDSVKHTRATAFSKSLRQFRGVESGSSGPLGLFKMCQNVLARVFRQCTMAIDGGQFPISTNQSRALDVLLSSVSALMAQVAAKLVELTPSADLEELNRGSIGMVASADSTISPATQQTIPVEVVNCLRYLTEGDWYGDIVRCVRLPVVLVSPRAALTALTTLQLLLVQAGEASTSLIDVLVQKGLPVFVLHTMIALFSDDLDVFTTADRPWATHPRLPAVDKFAEKVQAPLNRRRSVAGQSEEQARKIVEDQIAASVAMRTESDQKIPPQLNDGCVHILFRNQRIMVDLVSSVLVSSVGVSGSEVDDNVQRSITPISISAELKKELIYECVLLVRCLVSSAAASDKPSDAPPAAPETLAAASSLPQIGTANASPQARPPAVIEFFDQVLTPSLLHVLMNNFSVFAEVFRANKPTKRPLVIWNSQMNNQLKSYLDGLVQKLKSEDVFDIHSCIEKEGCKSFFHFLAEEVVVDGIYVKMLLDPQHQDDIGARNLPDFVELLQASVSSSKRVLELVQKRRQSMAGKTALVSQVSVKQQVLDHIVRQHPELGYSDLYVMDDQTY